MNLLGRLLIVLILVGSIIFMSFSVVLYATHTNWRERATTLQKQLDDKNKDLNKLQTLKDTMETTLKLEAKRQMDSVVALTETVRQLTNDNAKARDDVADLNVQLTEQTRVTELSLNELNALRERLDGASKAYFDAQNDWVSMSNQLTKKQDEAHSLALQLATYQSVCTQLAKDYAATVEVLRIHNLSPDPALYTRKPPAGIHGVVTEVRPRGVIEISVGSDSGLAKGHQLDVVRNREGRGSYVGKVEITETKPDRAIAIVMPEFRRGSVQLDDEVMYIEVNELTAR